MFQHLNNQQTRRSCRTARRRGLTLIELMMVTMILIIMAGAMAALASVVQSGSEFNQDHGEATQHGRVALERIERIINSATANNEFPGCFVYREQLNGWTYPDTLVVWHPETAAANPAGLPMIDELVVFCPNPLSPSQFLEIRHKALPGPVPALTDSSGWQTLLAEFKTGEDAQRVVLTDLLRTGSVGDSLPDRGVVRFDVRLRPSADEWSQFQLGARAWEDLHWAQSIHGSQTGLRQTWCRIELQLQLPSYSAADDGPLSAETSIPFFGSGAIYHELKRS